MGNNTFAVIVIFFGLIIFIVMIIRDANPSEYKIIHKNEKYVVKGRVGPFWITATGYAGFPYQFFKAIYDNRNDAEKFISRRETT